jgi:capsular exopolysaccharide synthesis family protein
MREEERQRQTDYEIEAYTQDMARVRQKMEQYVEETEAFMRESQLAAAQLELEEVRYVPTRLRVVSSRLLDAERVRDELARNPQWSVIERFAFIEKRLTTDARELVGMLYPGVPQVGTPQVPAAPANSVVTPSSVLGGESWSRLLEERNAAEGQFLAAKEKYLEAHPVYREAEEAFRKASAALDSAYASFENRLTFEIEHLSAEKESLERLLPVFQERQDTLGRLERDFERFTTGQLNLTKSYRAMAKRLEELDFGGKYERMQVEFRGHRLLSRPERPRHPNRLRLAMMSMAAGLVCALAAAFAMEHLSHTVSVIEQAEEHLGISGLGVIPVLATSRRGRAALLTEADHAQREVFRVIRTNLLLDQSLPEERKVIMVTSATPKEGKSMTAANLAVSFAQLGQKVLLIDADFHQGRQHRTFGVSSAPGLGGVLDGEISCELACQHSSVPNLDVMAKDRKGRNVSELLSRPALGEMIQELRQRYDRIIVDTPPVLGLSETCVLVPHVDGVVFVLWSSRTPVSQLQAALRMLAANGAQIFGCIVNRLDLGVATNYYYYYYYSDYYYHSYHRLTDGDGDAVSELEPEEPEATRV